MHECSVVDVGVVVAGDVVDCALAASVFGFDAIVDNVNIVDEGINVVVVVATVIVVVVGVIVGVVVDVFVDVAVDFVGYFVVNGNVVLFGDVNVVVFVVIVVVVVVVGVVAD